MTNDLKNETKRPGHGGRMSRRRKKEAVVRLLRGADLEMVLRELGVTAATLSGWQPFPVFAQQSPPRPQPKGTALRKTAR